MSPLAPVIDRLGQGIAELTGRIGRRVEIGDLGVTDRAGHLALGEPGLVSPNGACRLVQASDGWIAVNLARADDVDLIPAWLERPVDADPWTTILAAVRERDGRGLVDRAILLGLPVCVVGETRQGSLTPSALHLGERRDRRGPLKMLDTSALWAGPLCGAIFAAMGAQVTRLDSLGRPDPSAVSTPEFFRRLNHLKADLRLDLKVADDRSRLLDAVAATDVLITAARPRALAALGLAPETVFAANPALIWIAITGHGWTGEAAQRVAFGDDAAAAGGLLAYTTDGAPHFLGDALADPVTGLVAAAAGFRAMEAGGGVLIDVALSRCAAGAAGELGLEAAA